MTPGQFAEAVLAFCIELRASEVAGYRTDDAADKIGAPSMDAHRFGMARDVVYDERPSLASAITTAARYKLDIWRTNDHDHLQPLGWIDRVKDANA